VSEQSLGRRRFVTAAGSFLTWSVFAETAAGVRSTDATGFVATDDLVAFDPATGEQQWRYEAPEDSLNAPTAVAGTVYAGSSDDNVYAVDAATGEEVWVWSELEWNIGTAPTVYDGRVYVGSTNETFYALDARTGTVDWTYTDSIGSWRSTPHVFDGTLYAGNQDRKLYALDPETGSEIWTFHGPGMSVHGSPTAYDGTIYVGSQDESIYAVDAEDGTQTWEFGGPESWVSSAPAAQDGTVYVGVPYSTLYALDAETGNVEWEYDAEGHGASSPTLANGLVYFTDSGGTLYALDANTGAVSWTFEERNVYGLPTVYDGTLYVTGDENGIFFALDANTGDLLWESAAIGGEWASSPTVVDDASGNSVDSRVRLGTLGHHDGGDGLGSVAIEDLRLVQTVENTRRLAEDTPRLDGGPGRPASEDVVAGSSQDSVLVATPDPDLVQARPTAPVFDVRGVSSEEMEGALTVTARMLVDGEIRVERSGSLDVDVLEAGLSEFRADEISRRIDDPPDRWPLLELLADDRIDGLVDEYPTVPMLGGGDERSFELELSNPALDEPVTEQISIEDERVRAAGSKLSIGLVGIEKDAVTGAGSFQFDDDPDVEGFAEAVGRFVLRSFPVTDVDVAVLEEPVEGDSANVNGASRNARHAEATLTADIDEAITFRIGQDGTRLDDVDVHAVDVTLGVVPRDEFFEGWGREDRHGVFPTNGLTGTRVANAALVEIDRERVAAHEIVHYFLGEHFDDPVMAEGSFDSWHASHAIRSTGYDAIGDEFEVLPGRPSLLADAEAGWTDAYTYQGLVEANFEPRTSTLSESVMGHIGGIADQTRQLGDDLRSVPEETLEELTDAPGEVLSRLGDVEDEFGTVLEEAEHAWESADDLDEAVLERTRSLGADAEAIGADLRSGGVEFFEESRRTTGAVGRSLEEGGSDLKDRSEDWLEDGVEYVMEVDGEIARPEPDPDFDLDLDYRVVPIAGTPPSVDGSGTLDVLDDAGESIVSGGIETGADLIGSQGDSQAAEWQAYGLVSLPAEASDVEVSLVDPAGAERSTSLDPTTGPIESAFEDVPDRAFASQDVRPSALEDLETVRRHDGAGDTEDAASLLESLYLDLHRGIDGDYRPESAAEPTKDEVLARVGQQIQRFEGEVPELSGDDGLSTTWLVAGGGTAAAVTGYALLQYRDGSDDC